MPWPLSQDYNEAVQNAATCIGDAEMKLGEATLNGIGLPRAWSGNFADVYQMNCPQRKWAIKCFTREVPGLRERYSEISAYLAQAKLPFMVEFSYLDQGIRIKGKWYPALKMHWVEGFTLDEFVKQHADNPAILDLLAQIWLRMAKRLREAKMAHADLQHGNVLLVPGSTAKSLAVKLIDYDGMFVPALAQKRSGEVGHGAYQHPQRLRDGTYNAEVDRFPNLVVYTAIRALMVGSRYLWNKFDNGDNLLFKQSDLEAPEKSPVFQELMKLNDPEVRKLTTALAQAVKKPLEQTPLLEQLVVAAPPAATPARPSTVKPAGAAAGAENVFAEATADTGLTRRRTRGSGSFLWAGLAIAAVALLVVGLGVFFATRGDNRPPQLQSTVGVAPPKHVDPPKVEPKPKIEPKPEPKIEPKVEPKVEPKPEPIVKLPVNPPATFLADMEEFDVQHGPWRFGKRTIGDPAGSPIAVEGKASPNGIGMHPPDNGSASAKYRLGKRATRFQAGTAFADSATRAIQGMVTFHVIGDGKELWKSKPIQQSRIRQDLDVDVSGVDVLELRVNCAGGSRYGHAVWIEPRVQGTTADVATLGDSFTNSVGMKLVLIPAGKFMMGSPADEMGRRNDEMQHEVEITRPFYMGVHEVTQEDYQKLMGSNPSWFSAQGKGNAAVQGIDTRRLPVEQVSWEDARLFCAKLSALPGEKKAGRSYRLPTEAEWEYACRAGSKTAHFCERDPLAEHAWINDNSQTRTHPVGERKPNAWGLHDMAGNVFEWCADFYDANYYPNSPKQNPKGPDTGEAHVLRGGCFGNDAAMCRSSCRVRHGPGNRGLWTFIVGIRVACDGPAGTAAPAKLVYLSDLQEVDAKVGVGSFGKKGALGHLNEKIRVNGKESPNGLGMHPPEKGYAFAKYRLDKAGRRVVGAVGLNDSARGALRTPVTFAVLGDQKVLWASQPMQALRVLQPFNVSLTGVDVLELRVVCPAGNTEAHAVWFEPYLERQSTTVVTKPEPKPVPGKPITNSIGMKLAYLPAGKFLMGSPGDESGRALTEGPQHQVTLTKSFFMGVHEVSQAQYAQVMAKNPSYYGIDRRGGPNHPVEQMSWEDAREFCRKLSDAPEEKRAGRVYRLPTEAEWEYACRAGTPTRYSFGADPSQLGEYAWFQDNSGGAPHPVGEKRPNAWGLYDMHGNVWEWCNDYYREGYEGKPRLDPQGPSEGTQRVIRGGSWREIAVYSRCARRDPSDPIRGQPNIGFRVACDVKSAPVVVEPKPDPKLELKPEPKPDPTKLLPPGAKVYLGNLKEFDVKVPATFGKKGEMGYRTEKIMVDGKLSPNGLSMHGTRTGVSSVKYPLGKTAHVLAGAVGLADTAEGGPDRPLTFLVLGDGKELWTSFPIQTRRISQSFSVPVSGIDVLELRVVCTGSSDRAHAVWIEPHLKGPPLPVPDSAAQAKVEKVIRGLYKEDYAKKKAPELYALSEKLLQRANETSDDPVMRYVLWREARDLAAQSGEYQAAFEAIEEFAPDYTVDELALKATALTTSARVLTAVAANRGLVEAALALADSAVAADNHDLAVRLLPVAETAAKKAQVAALISRVAARSRDVRELQKEKERSQAALAALKDKPDDPDANLTVGSYQCLLRGDWEAGLPYLAKSSDAKLKELAARDRAKPAEPAARAQLADGWWDLAEADKTRAKSQLRRRAHHWYQLALAGLTGVEQARVEQRIKTAVDQFPDLRPADPPGEIRRFAGHSAQVMGVGFFPDGKRIVSGGDDTIRIWDVETGKELQQLRNVGVRSASLSPDGRRLLSEGTKVVRLWELPSGKEVGGFATRGGGDYGTAIFSPDGARALFIDGDPRLVDLTKGLDLRIFKGQGGMKSLAFSADGRRILFGSGDRTMRLVDVETGRDLNRWTLDNEVPGVAFSPDGRSAYSCSRGEVSVRRWDLLTGKELKQFDRAGISAWGLAISPDGRRLLTACGGGNTVVLWDARSGKIVYPFNLDRRPTCVAFSADGRRAVCGTDDGSVRLLGLPK